MYSDFMFGLGFSLKEVRQCTHALDGLPSDMVSGDCCTILLVSTPEARLTTVCLLVLLCSLAG